MKFTGNRQRLLEAFNIVRTVVPLRAIKPMLQNVRMIVGPDGATLLATDTEVAIRYRVPLDTVEEGGDIVVPAARLHGILHESDGERVTVSNDDRAIIIRCGRGRFKILGEDPESFPVIPAFEDRKAIIFPSDAFRTMVQKTIFAAAKERSRFAFNGVRLQVEADEARMIATDGKRMAVMMTPIDNPDRLVVGHVIPTKGLMTFEKVLTSEDESLRLFVDDKQRQIMIKTKMAEVSTLLVEGAFPRYESVVPKEAVVTADFNRNELIIAMRQAKLLTNEESRSVRLTFEDNKMVLTSRAMDVGEARVEIETTVVGTPVEVAFNPDFVVEGLNVIQAERVKFKISGRDTPASIEGDENYTYVVMPVTLRAG